MNQAFRNVYRPRKLEFVSNLENLVFYNEADIFPNKAAAENLKKHQTFGKEEVLYKQFLKKKGRRPNYDLYACYQPFNESFKAVFPFLKKLRKEVRKGDVILSLWDRSGWQTIILAGLFPDQHIIATWEGNKDVLGYKGFHFWMKNQKNVTILFCDLNKPLPIADKSIAFSCGYDTFHNFDQSHLLNELFRVVRKDGSILFPHVHLTNNEPDPFFERGCKQMHGLDYQNAFDFMTIKSSRQGYVFSEPGLFVANDMERSKKIEVVTDPDSTDYNATIAVLPESWKDASMSAFTLHDIPDIEHARLLINLLLNIDLNQQNVRVDFEYMDGSVGYLLNRHPIYVERIKALDNYALSDLESKMIYLAQKGFTVSEIADHLNVDLATLVLCLDNLEKLGLLQVVAVSDEGYRLQSFLMAQNFIFPKSEQNLQSLWQEAVALYPDNITIISEEDESEFTYEDCKEIVDAIITALHNSGIKKGDKVIICSKLHTEAMLLFWACMQLGVVVAPLGTHLPIDSIRFIQELTEASMSFVNVGVYSEKKALFENTSTIVFDEDDNDLDCRYFADWLEEESEEANVTDVEITHQDEAVILFTSGSTGMPKGVMLSHGNLFRSGRLISETFHWESEDRYFAVGGLESMSGLRNSVIVPLHVGAAVVVPQANALNNVFGLSESIEQSRATFLGSNPSFLRQLADYKDRIGSQLDSIKTIICTGNKLSDALRKEIREKYNLPILNYYGLTETTGICISQGPLDTEIDIDTIGKPVDCIAQIVDENDNLLPVGQEGELRIFSENIMQGYYKNSELTEGVIRNDWFYTNDIARYDEKGNIQLRGRKRNIIKVASDETIYLDEVQKFINGLDFIHEAVILPYRKNDSEHMAAFLVLKDPNQEEKEIKNEMKHMIERKLGEKKLPSQVRFLDKLPYTDNGKLMTKKLLDEIQ